MKIQGNMQIQKIMQGYKKTQATAMNQDQVSMKKDDLQISQAAKEVLVAVNALKSGSTEERAKKLEELRSLIEKGEYHPSSEDVAAKILESIKFDK
jgi:anti-sigma28 factor (negative regulator of flagellin synthesis)